MKRRIVVVVAAVLFCVGSFVAILQAASFAGYDLANLRNPDHALAWSTIGLVLAIHLIPIGAILLSQKFIVRRPLEELSSSRQILWATAGGAVAGAALKAIATALTWASSADAKLGWTLGEASLAAWLPYFVWYLAALNLNSLNEELIYRAFPIANGIHGTRSKTTQIVLASAALFSLVHFILEPPDVAHFLYRFAFGCLLGFVYAWRRSLWLVAGFHTGWNFISLSISDASWKEGGLVAATGFSSRTEASWNSTVLAIAAMAFYFAVYRRSLRNKQPYA